MAPLPQIRLRLSLRPFAQTAVDFGRPFVPIQTITTTKALLVLIYFAAERELRELVEALDQSKIAQSTARRSLMNFGDNVINIHLDFLDLY